MGGWVGGGLRCAVLAVLCMCCMAMPGSDAPAAAADALPSALLPACPQSIPGGVRVRYITGRGAHSAGGEARLRPEVIRLLRHHRVEFEEGPGWVEATLVSSPD